MMIKKKTKLSIIANEQYELGKWGLESTKDLFDEGFGSNLKIDFKLKAS